MEPQDQVCVTAGPASLRSFGCATAELLAAHCAKVVVELHGSVDCLVNWAAIVESPPSPDNGAQGFALMPTRDRCGANDDDLLERVDIDRVNNR